jgi:hypothetical protein
MACETFDLLERINRLSEVAMEFDSEYLGHVAAREIVCSAMGLSDALDENDETEEDTEEETSG